MISLDRLSASDLVDLFHGLEAPTIAEMDGEYRGQQLAQASLFKDLVGRNSLYNPLYPGHWLGKAFRPTSDREGRGYNAFRWLGQIVQRLPMLTVVAPSRFDSRPSFTLLYRAFHSLFGEMRFLAEVRRIEPGLYLGLDTWGFTKKDRTTALPFELRGPSATYVGDIGRPRAGFDLAKELLP